MNDSFSTRYGYTEVRAQLQFENLDAPTRNRIWNAIQSVFFEGREKDQSLLDYKVVWDRYFKNDVADLPEPYEAEESFHVRFKELEWHEIFSLIEFLFQSMLYNFPQQLLNLTNAVFLEEGVGYQIVDWKIGPVIEREQVEAIECALSDHRVSSGAKTHISKALDALRPHGPPDFADVIRESIHAVESQVKVSAGNTDGTLGPVLEELKTKHNLHPVLVEAFKKLYGYTNDSDGIRHALLDEPSRATREEAMFMLVACSAFVSFLTVATE